MPNTLITPQQRYDWSEKGKERHRRHYLNNKYKYLAKDTAIAIYPKPEKCSVEGCDYLGERHHPDYRNFREIVWLCRKHHLESHGRIRGKCSLCGMPTHARGWCKKHYNYWFRTGKEPTIINKEKRKCLLCDKIQSAKGLCKTHYSQKYRKAQGW